MGRPRPGERINSHDLTSLETCPWLGDTVPVKAEQNLAPFSFGLGPGSSCDYCSRRVNSVATPQSYRPLALVRLSHSTSTASFARLQLHDTDNFPLVLLVATATICLPEQAGRSGLEDNPLFFLSAWRCARLPFGGASDFQVAGGPGPRCFSPLQPLDETTTRPDAGLSSTKSHPGLAAHSSASLLGDGRVGGGRRPRATRSSLALLRPSRWTTGPGRLDCTPSLARQSAFQSRRSENLHRRHGLGRTQTSK